MMVRCQLPAKDSAYRLCGGKLGAAPDGARAGRELRRYQDAAPDRLAYRCDECRRISEVSLPAAKSLQDAA